MRCKRLWRKKKESRRAAQAALIGKIGIGWWEYGKKPTEKQLYKLKNEWLGQFFEEVKPKEFYRAVFPEGSFERKGHFEDGKANGIITIVENDKAKNRICIYIICWKSRFPLYKHLQDKLREFKYELIAKVWNRYTSTFTEREQVQYQMIGGCGK